MLAARTLAVRACVMRHTAEKLSADIPISRFPDFDIPIQHSTLPFVLASSMAVFADS
jgi:hypothetical protein